MYVCMYIRIYIYIYIDMYNSTYNLSLRKMKEEKHPSFATVFDRLDVRSEKLIK